MGDDDHMKDDGHIGLVFEEEEEEGENEDENNSVLELVAVVDDGSYKVNHVENCQHLTHYY